LSAIETSSPPIRALGITDYFGIERYEQIVEAQRQGRLQNVGLIFPNVELRLGIETVKASAINIHLLFSPHDADHVERIKRFLLEFEFPYLGESCRCQRADLAGQPDGERLCWIKGDLTFDSLRQMLVAV